MTIQYRRQLVDLLRHLTLPLIGAEIGVAEGNFSRDLLAAGMEKLFMIDVWTHIPKVKGDGNSPQSWHDQNYAKAKRQVKEFGDRAVFLRGKSVDMANKVPDNSLGLVYLDADHSFEGVTADIMAWYPKLVQGGIMAGHDYLMPQYGVKDAVERYMYNCKELLHLLPENKPEDAGFYFFKT